MKQTQVLLAVDWFLGIAVVVSGICRGAEGVAGRYVRIELPQRATLVREGRILSVAEIEVFAGGRNVAPPGKASQSSGRYPAQVAIDGETDNFTHSDVGEWNPWIEIDLGKPLQIDRLVIWNRSALFDRLNGFLVAVLDDDRKVVWYARYVLALPGKMVIEPTPFQGTYIGTKVAVDEKGWYDVRKEDASTHRRLLTDTLFPPGNLDALPHQAIDRDRPTIRLDLGVPANATARRQRFDNRNSDEEIARLCRRFLSALKPNVPGLSEFYRSYDAGNYLQALEAYRRWFFDKLAHPEKHGASSENLLQPLIRARGKQAVLMRPLDWVLEANLGGEAVGEIRGEVLVGKVGQPGTVNWAPADLIVPEEAAYGRGPDSNPFWRTPEGQDLARRIELCRAMDTFPCNSRDYHAVGIFPALLCSYACTGNKGHLDRWCAYVDDWCLNARKDQDDCPVNVRAATELEPQQMRYTLLMLRIILDERPELGRDFDAATLARLLMRLTEQYAPYTIRAKRAELANWGIMGIGHLQHVCALLPEYKALDYVNREAWRLWRSNFIQHRTLDGENCEAWDLGHNGVDVERAYDDVPFARLPEFVDELELAAFWDQVKPNQRSMLTHISPNGDYWPRWSPGGGFRAHWKAGVDMEHNSLTEKYLVLNDRERYWLDLIADEPGTRARIATLLAGKKGTGPIYAKHPPGRSGKLDLSPFCLPDTRSDIAPYAAMYYLRDSWQPGAEYLLMQNFLIRSQDTAIRDVGNKNRFGGSARTMYDLSKDGRVLMSASPVAVDRKPDNRWHDAIPTGGKTNVCGQAGRHVVDTRFHTTARFDLAESKQDAPYSRPEVPIRGDWYGLYTLRPESDNTPVTDVTAYRQVFHVRGEGIWIVADRLENESGASHEYSQFFTLPAVLHEEGYAEQARRLADAGHRLIQVDSEKQRLRTANPGFANVTAWFFGQDLEFANRLDRRGEHESITLPQIEVIREALDRGESVQRVIEQRSKRPVSVRWSAACNQALVTLLVTRPAGDAEATAQDATGGEEAWRSGLRELEELRASDGAHGFRAVSEGGAEVWFQSGPARANRLTAGPAKAVAESLLVVKKDGELSGMVLGCNSLEIDGRSYPARDDFEFVLPGTGALATTPIHRPIDTVRISPQRNVFTDRVEVSFDIPAQDTTDIEFRYTLDGSDPTLESKLCTGPFEITETTRIKVRPFRKGLKRTPWNIPGVDAGKTVWAIFRKENLRPAVEVNDLKPGLGYEYFESDWPTLFTYAGINGVLAPETQGTVRALLDPRETEALHQTDRAYAIRYAGYLNVPSSGVYSFYAPEHLYTTTMDAGYDLRVFIHGEEWFPTPDLHSENVWHIPLEKGPHRLTIAYTDYRWKHFRDEYWMSWQPRQMWQGTPVLEVSGPGTERRPVPADWLGH